jgi:hypothetical protein
LQRLKGFRKAEVKKLRMRAILPGSAVVSDGLSCFAALASPGQVVHLPIKTGGRRKSTRRPEFFWVNTVLANVKNNYSACIARFVRNTCRAISPNSNGGSIGRWG